MFRIGKIFVWYHVWFSIYDVIMLFWQNLCLIPWYMTSLVTSFCSISQILPLHRLCEQLGLIFTRYLWGVKMFNMTRGRFWQNIFLIPCLVLIYDVTLFCFVSLISPLYLLFLQLKVIFYEILIIRKVVQHDQRKILAYCFLIPCLLFDTMSLFWLIMSFVDVLLLCFTNFTTWSPLWTTQLDFYEISMRSKVEQRNNLANFVLITWLVLNLRRHLQSDFALFH